MLIHVNCVLLTATEVLAASLQQEHETNNQGAGMAKFHPPATTSKSFLLFLSYSILPYFMPRVTQNLFGISLYVGSI